MLSCIFLLSSPPLLWFFSTFGNLSLELFCTFLLCSCYVLDLFLYICRLSFLFFRLIYLCTVSDSHCPLFPRRCRFFLSCYCERQDLRFCTLVVIFLKQHEVFRS